jgi:hypothetical protein
MAEKIEETPRGAPTAAADANSTPSKQAKPGAGWKANEEQVLPEVRNPLGMQHIPTVIVCVLSESFGHCLRR